MSRSRTAVVCFTGEAEGGVGGTCTFHSSSSVARWVTRMSLAAKLLSETRESRWSRESPSGGSTNTYRRGARASERCASETGLSDPCTCLGASLRARASTATRPQHPASPPKEKQQRESQGAPCQNDTTPMPPTGKFFFLFFPRRLEKGIARAPCGPSPIRVAWCPCRPKA